MMEEYTDRLEVLQELMKADEWDKVIFDCQSLLQQLTSKHDADDDDADDASESGPNAKATADLRFLLLEIQAKSLLQQDEWQAVIDLFQKNKNTNNDHQDQQRQQPHLLSLAAYAHYRLKNYPDAKQLANTVHTASANGDDYLSRHVLAQCLYRLGQRTKEGSTSHQLYEELLSSCDKDDDEGRLQILTNALAVRNANAHPISGGSSSDNETTTTATALILEQAEAFLQNSSSSSSTTVLYNDYDLAYNLGTLQILTGNAVEGRATLQAAERAVQDEWAGDHDNADCRKELAPIQTNILWSFAALQANDGGTVAAGNTDFISKLNAGKTIPMKDMPAIMTPLQRRVYHYNQAILALKQTKQQKQQQSSSSSLPLVKLHCISLMQSFNTKKKNGVACDSLEEESWWKSRVAVLEAHVMEQQQKPHEAKKHLQQALTTNESTSIPTSDAATAWLQLHVARLEGQLEDPSNRLTVLQTLPPSILQSRAMVATRAALHQALGQDLPANLFDEQDAADFWLAQEEYEKAALYFEHQTDAVSRAKYALCLSYSDPPKALALWKELDIDVDDDDGGAAAETKTGDELEQLPLPRVKASASARAATNKSTKTKRASQHDSVLRHRAKQRDAYLTKLQDRGLDTTRPPNPDRWIPKYERSRNRKRGQHKGAQGGFTEKDAAKYDVAARQANGGVVAGGGPSTAHMTVEGGENRRGGRRR